MTLFKGGCLCGAVEYEIEGDALAFYHCHCQRCRKANGTGHASNVRVNTSGINWLRGRESIASYKVPEAERFRNDFCRHCGSPLPRDFTDRGFVVLPAGTLDSELPDIPASRIFCGSRVSWSCEDDLPAYAEYPPS